MVPEAVAEDAVSPVIGFHIGPGEAVAVLKVQLILDADAPRLLVPVVGEPGAGQVQGGDVAALVKTVVPQPQDHDGALSACSIGKVEAGVYVGYIILVAALFEAVDGDVDLVDSRRQHRLSPVREQHAVGGELGLEAQLPRDADHVGQLRMGQGLAHEVVVEVAGSSDQALRHRLEFSDGHHLRLPLRAGAEGAVSVAEVRNLHVNTGIGGFLTQNSTLSFRRGGW